MSISIRIKIEQIKTSEAAKYKNHNTIYDTKQKCAQFKAHNIVKIKLARMNLNMITKKANTVQTNVVEASDDEKHLNRVGDCETKT